MLSHVHKVAHGEGGGAAVPGWRVPGLQLTPSLHRVSLLLHPLQSTPPQVHCSAVPGWRVPGLLLTPSLHRVSLLLQPLQSTPPQEHCSAVPGWRVPGLQLTPSLHRLSLLLQPLQSTPPQVHCSAAEGISCFLSFLTWWIASSRFVFPFALKFLRFSFYFANSTKK